MGTGKILIETELKWIPISQKKDETMNLNSWVVSDPHMWSDEGT